MQIYSITANDKYKLNYSENKKFYYSNVSKACDSFVKISRVSFCSSQNKDKRQDKVDSFMMDLKTKMHSPNFSLYDISNSIRKYADNINIKSMEQAPKELLFSNCLQGLYSVDMSFDENNNKIFIPKKSKNFYVRMQTLRENYGNIWIYINAAHEFTHVLQYEDENSNPIGLFNEYIEKNQNDIDSALQQIGAVSVCVNKIEENLARPLLNTLIENEKMAYTRLETGKSDFFDWTARKKGISDFNIYVQDKVNSGIKMTEDEYGVKPDEKLLFDTIINHLEREIEAYQNEDKAHKICLGIDSPRALLRVQLYKRVIDILKEMKNS